MQETLEMSVVKIMSERNWTLTTVESCTGGAIASTIVDVPGASAVFMQGFITYANEAKEKWVLVKSETLKQYGAVSHQTAYEMAEGGCKVTRSDVAVSVTGIAGPGGGTKEKPVGLVYVGCCCKGNVVVKELHLSGTRKEIRQKAVLEALSLLKDCIMDSSSAED